MRRIVKVIVKETDAVCEPDTRDEAALFHVRGPERSQEAWVSLLLQFSAQRLVYFPRSEQCTHDRLRAFAHDFLVIESIAYRFGHKDDGKNRGARQKAQRDGDR